MADNSFSAPFSGGDAVQPDLLSNPNEPESSLPLEPNPAPHSSSCAKQRLQVQIELLKARPLWPKGASTESMDSTESMHSLLNNFDGVLSSDSAPKLNLNSEMTPENLFPAMPRYEYTRPVHPRVVCDQCDIQELRGEHELWRHIDREHPKRVKQWVCIESTEPGHPTPVLPFSKCKACLQQKEYGAYYNAAAHLRRTHFRPKLPSKSKIGGGEAKGGGKGGRDWPPMCTLKWWLKEVEVDNSSRPESLGLDDDIEDENEHGIRYDESLFPPFGFNVGNESQLHMDPSHFPLYSFNEVNDPQIENYSSQLPPFGFNNFVEPMSAGSPSPPLDPWLWEFEEFDVVKLNDRSPVGTGESVDACTFKQLKYGDNH